MQYRRFSLSLSLFDEYASSIPAEFKALHMKVALSHEGHRLVPVHESTSAHLLERRVMNMKCIPQADLQRRSRHNRGSS